jgi:hypothetical protein
MLRSWQVLALHCFFLWLLVTCSLSTPLLHHYFPRFYEETFFPWYVVIGIATMIGWSPMLGGCFLTKVENSLRAREKKTTYTDTFIVHYIWRLFGLRVRKALVTATLVAIMTLPVWVYYFG